MQIIPLFSKKWRCYWCRIRRGCVRGAQGVSLCEAVRLWRVEDGGDGNSMYAGVTGRERGETRGVSREMHPMTPSVIGDPASTRLVAGNKMRG